MRNIEAVRVAQALPGAEVSACIRDAKEQGFEYVLHNGRIFRTRDGEQVNNAYSSR